MLVCSNRFSSTGINGDLEELFFGGLYRVDLHSVEFNHTGFGALPVAQGAAFVEEEAGSFTNFTESFFVTTLPWRGTRGNLYSAGRR